MRYIFTVIFTLLFSCSTIIYAQTAENNDHFSYDISINYGLFPALIGDYDQPNLVGNIVSADYAYFFHNRMGFRTGLASVFDLEGTQGFYSVPILFSYRSKVQKEFYIGGNVDSFGDLLFQIILALLPKHTEYNIGINIGYINPENYNDLMIDIDGLYYTEGYRAMSSMLVSADAGLRLTYRIYRFGIVLSPSVSYLITDNFKYYSEYGQDKKFSPDWFMKLTFGLSYRF